LASLRAHYEREIEKAKTPIVHKELVKQVVVKRQELWDQGHCCNCRTIHDTNPTCARVIGDLNHHALLEVYGSIDDEDYFLIHELLDEYDGIPPKSSRV
jgi:hypothetical protein